MGLIPAKPFSLIPNTAPIKKSIRYLFLFTFLLVAHLYTIAQSFKPKWVNDLRGSSVYCVVTDLTVDKQNNIYVTGWFEGTYDFDPSAGVKNLTSVGQYDIFVAKYKQDGTLIWAESMGSAGTEVTNSIAVDKGGNVSISGTCYSATLDADPGPGVYILNNPDPQQSFGFIIHLDTNGNFVWAKSGAELYTQIATDSQGDVITSSIITVPVTIGDSTYTPPLNSSEGLISKYGPAGDALWSIGLISTKRFFWSTAAYGVETDSKDNIITTGSFNSTINFNPLGTIDTLNDVSTASFVAKYSPSGSLTWVNKIGLSALGFFGTNVGVDQQDKIYISIAYEHTITFGSITLTATGNSDDISFAKYSAAGVLQFAKSIGKTANVVGITDYIGFSNRFAFDKNNNFYLSGYFNGTINFNPNTGNPKNVPAHGPLDFYLAEYNQNGNYIYAFSGGSSNCESYGQGLAVDTSNNVDIGGTFCSTVNFDPSGCSPQSMSSASGSDGFIAQYASTAIANDVITAPPVTHFCTSGTPAAIMGSTPSGGSGAYTYQWQSSADSVSFRDIQGAASINYTPPLVSATTFYRRIVSASCAAALTSNIVALHVGSPPDAPQAAGDTVCTGATATLSVTSPQQGLTYNWYTVATGDTPLFTGISFTTPALNATTTYYAEADNGGCSSATRTAVTVSILQPLAAPVVTVGPVTATSITFEWTGVPGAAGYQVSIDSGKTYSMPSSGANGLTTTISGLQPGISITIMVQATGSQPCQLSAGSAAVTSSIPNNNLIYVPNAFTPNSGGKNDIVHVHSESIQRMTFSVFDQWGELIFTSTDLQNGWDGTYKGHKEPAGLYMYYVRATMFDGQQMTKKGTITLIR